LIEKYCLTKISNTNNHFTAVSSEVKEELIEIGINRKIIKFFPNGVDTNIFKPRKDKLTLKKEYGIINDKINIFSIGRLSTQKQPFKLINTFSKIEDDQSYHLSIAGKGPLEEQLKNYVTSKNLKNISFLGYVQESDKPYIYSSMDAFIISSIYEGIPLTLLESLSSGLPCIVSDITNFRTIIEESNAGIIINYDNISAHQKIKSFLESDLGFYSKNARKYAVEKFDWGKISMKYLELFRSIIE
jgi:glycosyltransferase involved in cell wall biosynthesis